MLGAQASPYRESGDLQVSCGFRYFKSHRHFVGDEEVERAEEGSQVINNVGTADIEIAYTLSQRWSLAASLPYLIAERSQAIRDFDDHVVARNRTSARGIGDAAVLARAWVLSPRTYKRANLHGGPGYAEAIGMPNVPTTLILDGTGAVVLTLAGQVDESMVRAAMDRVAPAPPVPPPPPEPTADSL